jgi:hypothetical protein
VGGWLPKASGKYRSFLGALMWVEPKPQIQVMTPLGGLQQVHKFVVAQVGPVKTQIPPLLKHIGG